ncbi:MAG TPA: hypothetical protein VK534_01870 [Methylomirabilota bacterium]|nr:hypothetical protein [Methylomirabilota bacterium]
MCRRQVRTLIQESFVIANQRIEVIPASELVLVDGEAIEKMPPLQFGALALLASKADTRLHWTRIRGEVWPPRLDPPQRKGVQMAIFHARAHLLHEELTDPKNGPIRKVGNGIYTALSEF